MPVLVDGPPMHLWLTYRVMASGDAWPLPALAERRNVYWDAGSVRQVDGVNIPGDAEAWLPDVVSAGGPIEPAAHRVAFPNGETVIARPVGSDGAAAADLPLPPDLRLAVILDRSRSMEARAAEVAAALATLRGRVGSPAGADAPGVSDAPAGSDIPSGTDTSAASDPPAPIDVYLTASTYRGEAPSLVDLETLDMAEMLYFGGQNPAEMLAQFGSLRTGRPYDAILVLTDDSSYTKPPEGLAVPVPDAPLWMVHLGGAFPPGYDDDTLQALQASGGGAAASIEEALARLAAGRAPLARTAATTVPDDVVAATSATIETHGASDIVDGYIWSVVATEDLADVDAPGMALDGMAPGAAGWSSVPVSLRAADIAPIPTDPSFAALAARRVILAAMQRTRGGLGAAENLDGLHAIAVDQGIVTPYSSMIVLVNDEQHRRLTELEKGADRFERSFEEFGETEEANPMAVTAVPEPEEWLLMIVAAGVLAWYAYGERNRRRMWGVG